MRPDLTPTACLPFEPEEARSLVWLPLAVRHKLDVCGLRLSLASWRDLPIASRSELLELASGPEFDQRALAAGASTDSRVHEPDSLRVHEAAKALDCDLAAAEKWLAAATPFARYALAKVRNAQTA